MTAGVARMDGWNTAGEVGGVSAGLVSIGAGIRWLLTRLDRRQALRETRLAQWEGSLAERERNYREKIERRLAAAERTIDETQGLMLEVAMELAQHNPGSDLLTRIMAVLRPAAPVGLDTLSDMIEQGRRM